ncbi:MAG: type II toxin-antitoxin system ParD family antitoxin [Acetobacteraceae bacterium]
MAETTSFCVDAHFTHCIGTQVSEGRFNSAGDAAPAGLRLLEEQAAWLGALRAALKEGEGSGVDKDPVADVWMPLEQAIVYAWVATSVGEIKRECPASAETSHRAYCYYAGPVNQATHSVSRKIAFWNGQGDDSVGRRCHQPKQEADGARTKSCHRRGRSRRHIGRAVWRRFYPP